MNQRFSAQALSRKTYHECRPSIMHFDKFIRPPVGARFIAPTADLSALWMFQYPGYFVNNYNRGAISAKKNLLQNETYLKQIAANAASGAGSRPDIEKILFQNETHLQQIILCVDVSKNHLTPPS